MMNGHHSDNRPDLPDQPDNADQPDFSDQPDNANRPDLSDRPDEMDRTETQTIVIQPGTLYLVGTPIGNLADLAPRAREVLAHVDGIAAEDTRRTRILLKHLDIRKPLESYHEHNRQGKGSLILTRIKQGQAIALVSDAGMPCISDPGAELVAQCVEEQIPVVVIPGPVAAVTALAGSGLATDRFVFEGFLPAEGKDRKERLKQIPAETRTLIFYEAPHRLFRTLSDLLQAGLGDRKLTLARELTKRYEEFIRLTVQGAQSYYEKQAPRGEYVLVLEGRDAYRRRCPDTTDPWPEARILLAALIRQGSSVREAARQAAEQTGLKKNDLYKEALTLQAGTDPL